MGTFWSLPIDRNPARTHKEVPQVESSKRMRMSVVYNDCYQRLFPILPDEISLQILARVPRVYYLNAKMVSRSWKTAITGSELYELRKEIGTTEEWLYIMTKVEDGKLSWHALDPLTEIWQRLPPMPDVLYEESKRGLHRYRMWNIVGSSIRIADIIRGWIGRRDALERLPFCGCSIGATDGSLYVLGGFSRASAMKRVWRYDIPTNSWQEVNPMTTGRAFCKTGMLDNKLYVVGGVSRGRSGLTPLQSAEVFDPNTGFWTPVASMPFSKAQVLPTAFFAEMLKPIATGMISYNGRLFVPQSLYSWPFFVDVGGEIYDPETDSWVEMPAGMGEGWPARQAGTKLSVVVNGQLYALDPSSSLDSGKIKMYDTQEDAWKIVIERVPLRDFTDSESPYLLAGFLGGLHVITRDANNNTTILQANMQNSLISTHTHPSSLSSESVDNEAGPSMEAEPNRWKVVAAKNFGNAELVSCQVLDV